MLKLCTNSYSRPRNVICTPLLYLFELDWGALQHAYEGDHRVCTLRRLDESFSSGRVNRHWGRRWSPGSVFFFFQFGIDAMGISRRKPGRAAILQLRRSLC